MRIMANNAIGRLAQACSEGDTAAGLMYEHPD